MKWAGPLTGHPRDLHGIVVSVPGPAPADRPRRVSILLPARNEEAGIREMLRRLPLDEVRAMGHDVDVVVVDGQSTDDTRAVARSAGARVFVQTGFGKGNAVRGALRALESDYVIMLDADRSYPEDRIPDFVRKLDAGYDVVMGSRLRGDIDERAMNGLNRVGNRGLSALATLVYGRPCTDVCTGMWGLNRPAIAALPLRKPGFEIEAELYAESVKSGLNVIEVPIRYSARLGETKLSKLGDGVRIATTLVECRLRTPRFAPWRERIRHAQDDGELVRHLAG